MIGEDEENSPWPPHHAELGFEAAQSSVTLLVAEQPAHISHQLSPRAESVLEALVDELRVASRFHALDTAVPVGSLRRRAVVVIGEDHRGFLKNGGWSRSRIQEFLAEGCVRDPKALASSGYSSDASDFVLSDQGTVSPYQGADDFMVVSSGSGGGRSLACAAVYAGSREVATGHIGEAARIAPPKNPSTIDDYTALVDHYMDNGFSDGWPVLPPHRDGVLGMIAASGREPGHIVGKAHWRTEPITVQDIAVNAYMAGCRPKDMQLLIPMFELFFSPANAGGVGGNAASTGGHNCWFFVRGPLAQELGINSGAGLFGPGSRVTLAIGRTVRMVMLNLAGLKPGVGDRSTLGQAYKYGVVIAERPDAPWGPLDTGLDLPPGASGVAVAWGLHTRLTIHDETKDPEALLNAIAEDCSTLQQFDAPAGRSAGQAHIDEGSAGWKKMFEDQHIAIVMSRGHQDILVDAGWSRRDVQLYLSERIGRHISDVRRAGYDNSVRLDAEYPDDAFIRLHPRPDHILLLAAGGEGGATLSWPIFFILNHPVEAAVGQQG